METIGIDLGFGQVNTATASARYRFPSVIGLPSATDIVHGQSRQLLENLQVDGYYVGNRAIASTINPMLSLEMAKTDSISDMVKYKAALGLALGDRNVGNFHVVTGLPADEYAANKDLRVRLQKNLGGTFSFAFGERVVHAHVTRVDVIPQGAAPFYRRVMDDSGNLDAGKVVPGVLIIDPGYKTTNVVVMRTGRYSPRESFTMYVGVNDVHKQLRRLLLREYGVQYPLVELDKILRDRTLLLDGHPVYIEDHIRQSVEPIAQQILSEIPVYVKNPRGLDLVISASGGGNLMTDIFRQGFSCPVYHDVDSEFDNAEGYRRYGLFTQLATVL